MKKIVLIGYLVVSYCVASSFINRLPLTPEQKMERLFMKWVRDFDAATQQLKFSKSRGAAQEQFFTARLAYKKTEAFVSWFSPLTESAINGPALRSVDDPFTPEEEAPHGLQVLEELLFASEGALNTSDIAKECDLISERIIQFLEFKSSFIFNKANTVIASKQELLRITSLGITGFDSPTAGHSLPEANAAINAIKEMLGCFGIGEQSLPQLLLTRGSKMIVATADFDTFDRAAFIRDISIPAYAEINKLHKSPQISGPINQSSPGFWSASFFNAGWYLQTGKLASTPERIALGKKLFFDPILAGDGIRSCATCHNPSKGFTDGLARSFNMDNNSTTIRNAPTLWNVALQPFQFLDMRAVSLHQQLDTVLNNHEEMGSSLSEATHRIKASPAYGALFRKAFGTDDSINANGTKQALAIYLQTLMSFDSEIDRFLRKETNKLNPAAYNGFNLFMGKAKCGTCHFAPLFSGVVPPRFVKMESEVIGVPATPDTANTQLDPDNGRFGSLPFQVFRFAFKTPTVRNISLTAPYMHNGVYKNLEQVVDFYNRGGGKGIGVGPDHQTLPFDELQLTQPEQQSLIGFLKALTDTSALSRR